MTSPLTPIRLRDLAERLAAIPEPLSSKGGHLRFGVCKQNGRSYGQAVGDEALVRLLCEVFNARREIAEALNPTGPTPPAL